MNADRLQMFVEADQQAKEHEAQLEYWRAERRKHEDFLLDQMGMEGRTQGLTEVMGEAYKVYVRRTTSLRVTNDALAKAELRQHGLASFIDEKIDPKLGIYWKKCEKAGENLPELEGLEFTESYRLYAMKKR